MYRNAEMVNCFISRMVCLVRSGKKANNAVWRAAMLLNRLQYVVLGREREDKGEQS